MSDYYYQDNQGQLRGPSTLAVLLTLKELGLLTSQTLIRDGAEGTPFPFADLEPRAVAVKALPLSLALPVNAEPGRTVDRWSVIVRFYFTIAQLYCFIAAILGFWQAVKVTIERGPYSTTLEAWLTIGFVFGYAFFEFCFYASLFFVFAYVKRRGLNSA